MIGTAFCVAWASIAWSFICTWNEVRIFYQSDNGLACRSLFTRAPGDVSEFIRRGYQDTLTLSSAASKRLRAGAANADEDDDEQPKQELTWRVMVTGAVCLVVMVYFLIRFMSWVGIFSLIGGTASRTVNSVQQTVVSSAQVVSDSWSYTGDKIGGAISWIYDTSASTSSLISSTSASIFKAVISGILKAVIFAGIMVQRVKQFYAWVLYRGLELYERPSVALDHLASFLQGLGCLYGRYLPSVTALINNVTSTTLPMTSSSSQIDWELLYPNNPELHDPTTIIETITITTTQTITAYTAEAPSAGYVNGSLHHLLMETARQFLADKLCSVADLPLIPGGVAKFITSMFCGGQAGA